MWFSEVRLSRGSKDYFKVLSVIRDSYRRCLFLAWRSCVHRGIPIVVVIGLLFCIRGEGVWATTPQDGDPGRVKTHRSMPSADQRRNTSSVLEPVPEEASATQAEELTSKSEAFVSYRDSLLTIDCRNTTLAKVLELVALKTGATIEVPPGTGLERIVEHIGPGPANAVMAHLLNGSHFNFIIVNSPQRPQDLEQVLLSLQLLPDTENPSPVPAPKVPTSSSLWKPSQDTASSEVLPPQNDSSLQLPTEPMSREALGKFMRSKAQELLEKARQENPQQ
jgi:hypothetical protein